MKKGLIAIVGVVLAMTGAHAAEQTNCDAKQEVCLTEGMNYFIKRQSSGADLYLKESSPNHDFRIAFWVKIVRPIADKKVGDTCNFADGAEVKVVQKFKDHDGYLVKYLGGAEASDACPVDSYTQVAGVPLLTFKSTKSVEHESRRILQSHKK